MVRNHGDSKFKSARRRPLRDVSNGGVKSLKSTTKKMKLKEISQNQQTNDEDPLDRLLLVHSDISALLRQIDELVVQSVKVSTTDSEKINEIKSFTSVLSEIHSSLKPWVPRLEKALSLSQTDSQNQVGEPCIDPPLVADEGDEHAVDTPEPTKHASLVSPSPLVSWRATGCLEERGKQLFLLTPLVRPKTTISKSYAFPKLTTCEKITSNPIATGKSNNEKVEVVSENLESTSDMGFMSTQKPTGDFSEALTTPCLKNLPLKTYVLYDPSHDFSNKKIIKSHKSTPFPIGDKNVYESTDSETSSGEISEKLGFKYPELIGIKPSCMPRNESRALDASPAWMMSPPKCCTLLEPLDEKHPKDSASLQELANNFNQKLCLAPTESDTNNINQDRENKKLYLQGNTRSNIAMVESTPLWKGCESTIRKGKHPAGENTLKRELWARFEAASTDECPLNFGVFKDDSQKGFLERLEEASDIESNVHSDALR